MSKQNILERIATDPKLPKAASLQLIESFLDVTEDKPIPDVEQYLNESLEKLTQRKEQLETQLKEIKSTSTDNIPIIPHNQQKDTVRKFAVLTSQLSQFNNAVHGKKIEVLEEQLQVTTSLLSLVEYLKENPLQINVVIPDLPDFDGLSNQDMLKQLQAIQELYKKQQEAVDSLPIEFSVAEENLIYFRDSIDSALEVYNRSLSYFPPQSFESALFEFLDSAMSPLTKTHLVPIAIMATFDAVTTWIESAVSALVKFDDVKNHERRTIIQILSYRFVFDRTYPYFETEKKMNDEFLQKMIDYKTDIVCNEEAKEWLCKAQFYTCPLDAAYCLYRAQESMAQITFDINKGIDQKIMQWAALITQADIGDPYRLYHFISTWSRIGCFTSRFHACLQFFELALNEISK